VVDGDSSEAQILAAMRDNQQKEPQ
jgi:hypothetical protein